MVMDAESDLGSADLPQDPVIKQQLPLGYKNLNEMKQERTRGNWDPLQVHPSGTVKKGGQEVMGLGRKAALHHAAVTWEKSQQRFKTFSCAPEKVPLKR